MRVSETSEKVGCSIQNFSELLYCHFVEHPIIPIFSEVSGIHTFICHFHRILLYYKTIKALLVMTFTQNIFLTMKIHHRKKICVQQMMEWKPLIYH